MFFLGLGTAAPERCYRQEECWEALRTSDQFGRLAPRSRSILRKVLLGDNGISTRFLSLDPLQEAFDLTPGALHARFRKNAPKLASKAARAALENAGVSAKEIDAVLVSTCTGYLCPGLTSYVSEELGLRPAALALDFAGQGCGAAAPNLRAAQALLLSRRCDKVLSICVEVCSAAFYLDDDPGVLISACLFGDGAGAAVLGSRPASSGRQVFWRQAKTLLKPEHRDRLRFEQTDGMLRNILDLRVPALVQDAVGGLFSQMLADSQFTRAAIRAWILHAGGRDVLQALRECLGLSPEDVRWSAEVLRHHGNVSSPSVFFSLERALSGGAPPGIWWLATFGAGFSCHGAFLEVDG